MIKFTLDTFTQDESFPFFIQFGRHDEELFVHSHDDFSELVIVMEGSAQHIVNSESYQISRGDVFVIGSGIEHGFSRTKNLRICNIMFRPDFWNGEKYDIVKTAGFQALFVLEPSYARQNRFCSRLKLSAQQYDKAFSICSQMCQEYSDKLEGWKTMFLSGFLELSAMLSRIYTISETSSDDVVKLAKAVSFIENHFDMDMSVAELAAMSNYSERQFIRLFKASFGCRPTEYIRSLRLRKAKMLLKSTDMTVSQIATACGYGDSNYFTRVFRTAAGQTPTAFRISI